MTGENTVQTGGTDPAGSLTRRLLSLARDSRAALTLTVLAGFLGGLLTILQASALSRVVDGVFVGGRTLTDSAGLLRGILIIILLRALLVWMGEVSSTRLAVHIKNDLRQRVYAKIRALGPAFTRDQRTGELANAAVEGVEALDAYFSQYLPQLVVAALVPLSILVVVFPQDPLSGLVLLLTAPLIPVFMILIGKAGEALTRRQWDTLSHLSAHFLDSLQGLTTLKEFGRSRERADSISEASDRFRDVTLGVLRVTFLSALVLELVATISTAIVAVEVGLRLLYGHMAFQPALFLLLLAPEFYIPLRMLGLRFHAGMSGTSAARRIFEILDVEEKKAPITRPVNTKQISSAAISFSGVSYTYPGESHPALQDVNLLIEPGAHVALVGASGAGKSTLVSLLLGFVGPDAGSISLGGVDLNEIPLEDWRAWIAWVPQAPHLFHDTITANLQFARPQATQAELFSALQAANLDGFVKSLPLGLDTMVGEGGTRLSGGEAQRLAIARAFLKDAPILVLDEPTSSLDPENEQLIQSAIQRLMKGRTVITIAHRLNTVYQADRIFVFAGGYLVESGSHENLMALGELYAKQTGASLKEDELYPVAEKEGIVDPNRVDSFPEAPAMTVGRKPQGHSAPILRLLAFLNGSWGWVLLSVLLGVLTIGSNIGLMSTSAYLISAAALHPELGALQVAIVGVRFFGIARGGFRYAERLTTHNTTFRLLSRLRSWFYRALEPLAPARLMQYRSGDLLARVVSDVGALENFYVRAVAPPLVAAVVAAGMLVIFGGYDWQLGWVYLAFMVILGAGVPLLSWLLSRTAGARLTQLRASLQARLVDGVQGLADLIVFDGRNMYMKQLQEASASCGQAQLSLGMLGGLSSALTTALVNLGMLVTLALGIRLVEAGKIPGVMLAVLALAALAGFEAVMPLPLAAQTLATSTQSARRLFDLVDAEPAVKDPLHPLYLGSGELSLQVADLYFTYPDSAGEALTGLDFSLPPGKRLAIVGPSGAGKSSLVNLLMRYWERTGGRIMLDDHDIREYAQDETRRMFSHISQRTYLFTDTVRQNLLLARPAATEAELFGASCAAQIHEFILGLPQGYETPIGEQGFHLSGGERQRLAVARAFLKNAPIYLLDEPTANLDPVTERSLLDALFSSTAGRSLVLITHRLVGMEHMDEIIVLDSGQIVERGTHTTLIARGGLYRRLWDLQNRIMEEKAGA